MTRLTTIAIFFYCLAARSQNSLHLFSASGTPFRVLRNEKPINAAPQTDVVMHGIMDDTLRLKVEFDNRRYGITVYLMDKGRPATNREFTYRIEPLQEKVNVVYMGSYPMRTSANPLVPDRSAPAKEK